MSGELIGYSGGGALRRDAQRAHRQVGRLRLRSELATVESDEATNVAMAKVENLTIATGNALQQVSRVSMAQRQLTEMCPEAAGRLDYLAQDHTLACAELLGDLRRDLRRIR